MSFVLSIAGGEEFTAEAAEGVEMSLMISLGDFGPLDAGFRTSTLSLAVKNKLEPLSREMNFTCSST
jgi:hypothetical protein